MATIHLFKIKKFLLTLFVLVTAGEAVAAGSIRTRVGERQVAVVTGFGEIRNRVATHRQDASGSTRAWRVGVGRAVVA